MADPRQAALLRQAHDLLVRGERDAAETLYRELLQSGVENAGLLCNLAVICWQNGQLAEMEELLRRALAHSPNHADAHYNLALVLAERGASRDAIHHYRQALPLASSQLQGSIHWNLSKLLLRQGDYNAGWEHYEWRRHKRQPLPPICLPGMPAWDGMGTPEELVLVGEQGLGDMFQFLRYVPVLAGRLARISLCLPEKLHGLMHSSGLQIPLRTPAEVVAQRHGRWLPLLSVPRLLGVTPQNVLVQAPYLAVPTERVAHWRDRLRCGVAAGTRVIGLHWQGNPATETSELRGRSLPLNALAPLAQQCDVRFVSLQKGPGSEQLSGSAVANRLVPCQPEVDACWDFVETGAIALACDLVISTDSALVHLAGALGVPTWLLLHQSSDWRWGEAGDTSFWYPSLRLFRQTRPGDWGGVIGRVVAALGPASLSAAAPLPVADLERQAVQLLQQNRPAEAETIYRQLLDCGQASASTYANLGAIHGASGRLEEAERLLREALLLNPDNPSAMGNLAEALCQRQAWQEAEPLLRRTLELSPGHLPALNRLRRLCNRAGQIEEAVALAKQAVLVAPQDADLHFELAQQLAQAGQLEQARASLKHTLNLAPHHTAAVSELARLRQLQPHESG